MTVNATTQHSTAHHAHIDNKALFVYVKYKLLYTRIRICTFSCTSPLKPQNLLNDKAYCAQNMFRVWELGPNNFRSDKSIMTLEVLQVAYTNLLDRPSEPC